MRADTLTGIKVFRQVVEYGSFLAAAERLDLSPAMVSKHVMQVEKRLGVRLLNRNRRTLSITEPGRVATDILQPGPGGRLLTQRSVEHLPQQLRIETAAALDDDFESEGFESLPAGR